MAFYYFLPDLTELDIKQTIQLTNNFIIRSATEIERMEILKYLERFKSRNYMIPSSTYQDFSLIEVTKEGGRRIERRHESDLRYFLIENVKNEIDYNLPRALLLIENEFFVPFVFNMRGVIAYCLGELSVGVYYNDIDIIMIPNGLQEMRKPYLPKSFCDKDISQFIELHSLIEKFNYKKHQNISKSIDDFCAINEISDYSTFKVVSCFACIELLIVNGGKDRINSISSQLEGKLNLLNNLFVDKINITEFIKGPDTLTLGKVIRLIYDYRSSIAHGNLVDFSRKLSVLSKVSIHEIINLLRLVIKKIIYLALKEPQLIDDLKKC